MSKTKCLLLDFDGPICDIFAGMPASVIASRLRVTLEGAGAALPKEVRDTSDPLEIFRFSASLGEELNRLAHRVLTDLEIKAVGTARPTPGTADLIKHAQNRGISVGIASNNSAMAVAAFLDHQGLAGQISYVSARSEDDPSLMKPDPYLLNQALIHLNAQPASAVLVGDSVTDIEASKLAGIFAIGYANRSEKVERLAIAGAGLIVTDMAELTASLIY
ncbi:HAD family hydrolase [Nonomuraea sp. NPDC049646]|uniref:HAD family hydrolase n=1 Tax=unclassified Nonomuraea TaxID=2593643 RepID=UPI00378B072F